ncbi:hypothetical protein LBYZC6_39040 [Lacrimispora brassicae]
MTRNIMAAAEMSKKTCEGIRNSFQLNSAYGIVKKKLLQIFEQVFRRVIYILEEL